MKINNIQNAAYLKNSTPNFKSVYPVCVWMKKQDGTSYPVYNIRQNRTLIYKLIRRMNGTLNMNIDENKAITKRIQDYISRVDKDFAKKQKAKSFSKTYANEIKNYIITGDDLDYFDENFSSLIVDSAKNGDTNSDISLQKSKYKVKGYNFVERRSQKFVNKEGKPKTLNVLFEPILGSNSKPKDYKIVDMKFSVSV